MKAAEIPQGNWVSLCDKAGDWNMRPAELREEIMRDGFKVLHLSARRYLIAAEDYERWLEGRYLSRERREKESSLKIEWLEEQAKSI